MRLPNIVARQHRNYVLALGAKWTTHASNASSLEATFVEPSTCRSNVNIRKLRDLPESQETRQLHVCRHWVGFDWHTPKPRR
ncbi:MAG: hypothetical protein ACJAYX_003971 [Planctomycetota bacterium]